MHFSKLAIATLALLLAACSSAASTRTPTAQFVPAETNAVVSQTATTTTTLAVVPETPPETPSVQNPTIAPTTAIEPATATPIASATTAAIAQSPTAVTLTLPQTAGYQNLASPVDLLASYFDAINLQEYERAYSYWQPSPLDYATFAGGYENTVSVQLIVQPPTRMEGAAGSLYAAVPSVLVAQHTDGSTHTFAGCITTRKSNLQPPDIPEEDVWHIYEAQLEEVVNASNIPALLAGSCTP